MHKLFLAVSVVVLAGSGARAQVVSNGSFEVDAFAVAPGSVASNAAITGWVVSHPERTGLNPAGGTNDFANNGAVPAGTKVAWLQSEALQTQVLSQVVDGFTPGQAYKISMRVNSKATTTNRFQLGADGVASVTGEVTAVGGTAAYLHLATVLNATSTSHSIEIANVTGVNTNSILLVDSVSVSPGAGGWSFFNWSDDASSGVTGTNIYTHAYNFGPAPTNTTINGVLFTAVTGNNPTVAGSFASVGMGAGVTDVGNVVQTAGGGSASLMRQFIYNGNLQSITLSGLTPGVEYVFTVYSATWVVGWRTVTFENGNDRLTVNQEQFGNDQGIAIQHRYTAPISGTITLSWNALKNGTTIHVYGFSNRTAGDTPPVVGVSPRDRIAALGSLSTFRATTGSTQPMDQQWMKNGADIANETNATLTVGPVSAADIAGYSLRVSNVLGVATSAVANLTIGHISNPSFETDVMTNTPGYVSANFPINGWEATPSNKVGVNPLLNGQIPFAGNGVIPQGTQFAFIQATGTISTVIGGLTNGAAYTLGFRFNARDPAAKPLLHVSIDGSSPLDARVSNVGVGGPYHYGALDFIASGTTAFLVISNDTPSDTSILLDDFSITPSALPIAQTPWTGDATAGLDTTTRVTHAYKFNSAQGTIINNFNFTGVAGVNPAVTGRFSTAGFTSGFGNDVNNITALGGGSAILARDFIFGGSNQTLVITGLVPGVEYEASLYAVAFDLKAYGRTFTFNCDGRRQTINQDHYDNNNGLRITARYVANASGEGRVIAVATDPASTFHFYGFMNREVLSTNAPTFYVQPAASLSAFEGSPFADTAALVGGAEPLAYVWHRNGIAVPGQTSRVLSVAAAVPGDSGTWTLVASNPQGAATSTPVTVRISYNLPGLYSTGLGDNRAALPGGATDPHYRITYSDDPLLPGPNALVLANAYPIPPYLTNTTASVWISAATNPANAATGKFTYATTFLVDEQDPAQLRIEGRLSADDGVIAIRVNGIVAVGVTAAGHLAWTTIALTNNFIAGLNTIEFDVFNSAASPCAFRAELAATGPLTAGSAPAIVNNPPALTEAQPGTNLRLTAGASGSADLLYQWYFNTNTPIAAATNHWLDLTNITEGAEGWYTLRATNTLGTATSAAAQIIVLGPLSLAIGGGGANLIFRWQETSEPWALFETENLLADPVTWTPSDAPISNVTPWKIITIPPTNTLKYYRLEIVPST